MLLTLLLTQGTAGGTNYTLTATAGTYALTGGTAALSVGRKITALAGSYGVTGGNAALSLGRTLTALAGSYGVTGYSANLTKTGAVAYTLTAQPGVYTLTGGDASMEVGQPATNRPGFEMGGRKVYIKRGKRIHIFDTLEDADEWLEAEQQSIEALSKAKPTPRKKAKVFKALDEAVPHDVVRLDVVRAMVDHLGIPVEMPTLEARQDWAEVARVALIARQLQDEEDIEMLLAA